MRDVREIGQRPKLVEGLRREETGFRWGNIPSRYIPRRIHGRPTRKLG